MSGDAGARMHAKLVDRRARVTAALVGAPRRRLPPRVQQVAELVLAGKDNRDIAAALGCAYNTVKVHVARLYALLGLARIRG